MKGSFRLFFECFLKLQSTIVIMKMNEFVKDGAAREDMLKNLMLAKVIVMLSFELLVGILKRAQVLGVVLSHF